MLLIQFQNETSALEEKISLKRNEYRTIKAKPKSLSPELRKIVNDIAQLPINNRQKKQILNVCNDLLESERNQKKTNFPLTSTDSAFLSLLHQQHPNLDNRELKICLLIKLCYNSAEIAAHYAMTKRGVESIRYRLHKKIGLQKNQPLKKYLTALAEKLGSSL